MAGVYTHIRKDKNEPFYHGIFEDPYRPFEKSRRNSIWDKIVSKTEYEVVILKENLTWEDACQMEKELIQRDGRIDLGTGCLANMTDGGDGAVGLIRTEEHSRKISESQKGKIVSEETKSKVSEGLKKYFQDNPGIQKGRTVSEDTRKKLSKAKKGQPANPKSIEAMRQATLGKKRSQETKDRMSLAAKNRKPMSQEVKDKISKSVTAVQTGRPCKEETKLKISQTLKRIKKFPVE
jgi:hypothetical protein